MKLVLGVGHGWRRGGTGVTTPATVATAALATTTHCSCIGPSTTKLSMDLASAAVRASMLAVARVTTAASP